VALVFVSHSSRDDGLAGDLETWLNASGFTDLFVDHSSIAGGEAWADALRASAGACRVVICLVTPNWLASSECPAEFRAAWYMGKRIVPLFLHGDEASLSDAQSSSLARVRAEAQGIGLEPFLTSEGRLDFGRDEGRAELLRRGLREAGALARVGLDPAAFAFDRQARPTPFPGLTSFGDDDADAALFFGRSREIADTLEELRAMRAASDRRPLVILGASGAGKSSLLKAGIIPRLRREAPAWIPMRAFRPGADPLLNFAEALTRTLSDFGVADAHGALRRTLFEAWKSAGRDEAGRVNEAGVNELVALLEAQGARLRTAAGRPEATILVSVDQAEEMARAEGDSGEALADYLRAAMASPSPWRLAFTIRTDSFPELQSHRRFQGLEARGYDLRALPVFRFNDVVEAPARRYGVEIDPALVDALMEDAPKEDALPLLAFAMQRLWDQFAAQKMLRAEDYRSMGGLSGLIEDAAERALCGVEPEQRDTALPTGGARKAQQELGARTFVPPLADVNDDGAAIRRVAAWKDFDEEQQALLDRFGRWRLIVRKAAESDGGTVEVAHEALFREWTRLKQWLEPERARLEALRALGVAAAAWTRKNRRSEFLTHFGQRLKDAAALEKHARYGPQLGASDRAYLAASRKSERKAAGRRRSLQAMAAVSVIAMAGVGAAYLNREALEPVWAKYTKYWGKTQTAEALAAMKPVETFQDCATGANDCPVMVIVPAGKFRMGDEDYLEDQREVTVPRFAVSETEITFDDWDMCAANGGCRAQPRPGDATWGRGRQPVINVSWEDAQQYVSWLSQMTGATYRLLSEVEWEYAARAGTVTAFSFGAEDTDPSEYAWFDANSDGKSHPVQTRKDNAFGLYDMHGNVWEWVEDCYADYDPGKKDALPVSTDEPDKASEACSYRVLRGGSLVNDPQDLRSAIRGRYVPSNRYNFLGFRVARTLSSTP
jgi:formylglycine-generating enzyme required for sulfatase activity